MGGSKSLRSLGLNKFRYFVSLNSLVKKYAGSLAFLKTEVAAVLADISDPAIDMVSRSISSTPSYFTSIFLMPMAAASFNRSILLLSSLTFLFLSTMVLSTSCYSVLAILFSVNLFSLSLK